MEDLLNGIYKFVAGLLFFCFAPLWGLLPVIVGSIVAHLSNPLAGIIVGVVFALWFYGKGIILIPFDK